MRAAQFRQRFFFSRKSSPITPNQPRNRQRRKAFPALLPLLLAIQGPILKGARAKNITRTRFSGLYIEISPNIPAILTQAFHIWNGVYLDFAKQCSHATVLTGQPISEGKTDFREDDQCSP